ncbi:hypothetical protein N0O92_12365 [Alkalihalobacillus sp. MEB130]|uniref:hypothetical protein n=1 Tax=Alkalihalobacillus sp. MEB130 TaxID=2976704 RepID=UPI0028DE24B1|nr:hypothetical protein [Alkalihalobacillus sp. MEB130]MDT8861028.1 hypothetical protein [Alkalihalobacillus sp. MEB130]
MERLMPFFLLLLVVGCSTELTFTEMTKAEINGSIQEFIEQHDGGISLFFDEENVIYIVLNSEMVLKDQAAFHLIGIESNQDILTIHVSQKQAEDLLGEKAENQKAYKVNLDKPYTTIRARMDERDLPFNMVSGK